MEIKPRLSKHFGKCVTAAQQERFLRHSGPQHSFGRSLRRPHTAPVCTVTTVTCTYGHHLPTKLFQHGKFQLSIRCTAWDIVWRKSFTNHPFSHPISSIWHCSLSCMQSQLHWEKTQSHFTRIKEGSKHHCKSGVPTQNLSFPWAAGPPSNTTLLGTTQVSLPNAIQRL